MDEEPQKKIMNKSIRLPKNWAVVLVLIVVALDHLTGYYMSKRPEVVIWLMLGYKVIIAVLALGGWQDTVKQVLTQKKDDK